ncbi:MAG: nucleotidyltransferase domain-containing protein [Thermodesulfovibrionales bacterium]|nr:nucleotidyltransferase domain-containing protein [Thermodesulfovibrionales bacterium]
MNNENFKTYTVNADERNKLLFNIKSILSGHEEIIFAYIYGSFIDPVASFFRDIDIGIYVDETKILSEQFIDYSIALSLKIESAIKKYPVDVVLLNIAPLSLAFRITQGELLFIRDEGLWTDFVTKTWSMYHDHAITSRYILEDIIKS